jgi:hypothetical protein
VAVAAVGTEAIARGGPYAVKGLRSLLRYAAPLRVTAALCVHD